MEEQIIGQATTHAAKLAEYGSTGVAIAALIVVAVLGWLYSRAMSSQAKEHREAMRDQHNALKETVDRNTAALQENAKATAQLTGSLPHVCRFR
jgi:uncharacterized membrane-anchored protein YhcB (DUF1043 family)